MCFLTCYPQLLYNFVYKVPLLSECLGSVAGILGAARFLFSRDLIISEVRPFPCRPGPSCDVCCRPWRCATAPDSPIMLC